MPQLTRPRLLAVAVVLLLGACGMPDVGRSVRAAWLSPCGGGGPVAAVTVIGNFDDFRPAMWSFDVWGVLATGELENLTRDGRSSQPAFFADGRRLLYLNSVGGEVADSFAPANEVRLLDLTTGETASVLHATSVGAAVPSPDGQQVAFVAPALDPRLWVGRVQLVPLADPYRRSELAPTASGLINQRLPAWAPDGRRVAYIEERYVDEGVTQTSLVVVDVADASRRVTILLPVAGALSTDWSPDGTRVAVTGGSDGRSYSVPTWEVRVDTGQVTELTRDLPLGARYVSRDGSRIAAVGGNKSSWVTFLGPAGGVRSQGLGVQGMQLDVPACALR
ncbi:MAG TPA: hypothetical protein VF661_03680 [Actinomycetales bacterium]